MSAYTTLPATCALHKCVLVTSAKAPMEYFCWPCSQLIQAGTALAEAVEGCGHCDRGCGDYVRKALLEWRSYVNSRGS